jgi:hypothetical protein
MESTVASRFVILSNVRLPQRGLISQSSPTSHNQASPTMFPELEERVTKQTQIYRALEQGVKILHDPPDAEVE